MTGTTYAETIEAPRSGGAPTRILRVRKVVEFITCADCWRKPEVLRDLQVARDSGVLPGASA